MENHRTSPRFNVQYGVIKFDQNNDTFTIIDKTRNIVYDSSTGFIDVEAISPKGELLSEERHRVIIYLKQRMKCPTDKATISAKNYMF